MITDEIAALVDDYPGLSRAPAALLLILMRGRGRTQPYDLIHEQYLEIMGYRQGEQNFCSSVKRLRQQLNGRLTVTTTYQIGLKLEKEVAHD